MRSVFSNLGVLWFGRTMKSGVTGGLGSFFQEARQVPKNPRMTEGVTSEEFLYCSSLPIMSAVIMPITANAPPITIP